MVEENTKKKKKATSCLGEALAFQKNEYGEFNALLNQFQIEDPTEYQQFLCTCSDSIYELIGLIEGSIPKEDTILPYLYRFLFSFMRIKLISPLSGLVPLDLPLLTS